MHGEEEKRGPTKLGKIDVGRHGFARTRGTCARSTVTSLNEEKVFVGTTSLRFIFNAQAFNNPEDAFVRGRLLSSGKNSLEILTEEGTAFHRRDVIVKMVLVAHTRPAYIDDKELLALNARDMKRRSKLHEKVEKETKGNDDSHLRLSMDAPSCLNRGSSIDEESNGREE